MSASDAPVANRNAMAIQADGATRSSAFSTAAARHATVISAVSRQMSASANTLDVSAPTTKPACTAFVSQLASAGVRPSATINSGIIAVAENHVVSDSTPASPANASADQRAEAGNSAVMEMPSRRQLSLALDLLQQRGGIAPRA